MTRIFELTRVIPHTDDRGFLYQIYEENKLPVPNLKRVYVVGNFARGTIRGFHKHLRESKYYFVASGAAKFVVIKEERESQKSDVIILSARDPSILEVGPGHYHGWLSLEENTLLVGMSTKTFQESIDDDIRIDPFAFGDVWKVSPR